MPTVSRTIVIIHPGSLGDVLLAVPAMVRLRARFPSHMMALCAQDQVARLLVACHVIDAWVSAQGRDCAELFAGAEVVRGPVRTWLEDCDLAVGWTQDVDGTMSETLKALGACKTIVQSPFSNEIRAIHQCDRFLETIDEPSCGESECNALLVPEPLLHLGRACLEAAGLSIGQSLAVIHPGSGSIHKCVEPEALAAVIAVLQDSGVTPVILEGPADRESVQHLLGLCEEPPILLKDLDLLTVAGVLVQAALFVGQDSGISHLAGLIGVRTVALFGPTDPIHWAPRGTNVTVIQGAPCLCRSWAEVSRCEEKPCLKIEQDRLVAHCVRHLNEVAVQ
ncbi:MAG: glycosyltransferase family 9 protein [Nitrospira sp.]|nr:MAG: glycosyltransferase family 9 protein [Nitrospira sp.]